MSDSHIPSFLVSDVSKLLRSLTKNEQTWAIRSDRSPKMSEWVNRLFFWANHSFAHFFAKNERIAQKTNERIPSPDYNQQQHHNSHHQHEQHYNNRTTDSSTTTIRTDNSHGHFIWPGPEQFIPHWRCPGHLISHLWWSWTFHLSLMKILDISSFTNDNPRHFIVYRWRSWTFYLSPMTIRVI